MCLQKYCHGGLVLALILLVVLSVDSLPTYDNRDLYRFKLDPTRMQFSEHKRHKHVPRTVPALLDHTIVNTTITLSPHKKWQVGRVSRKHYEIINMLWRKTKDFVDFYTSTANNYNSKQPPVLLSTPRLNLAMASTPSFIEFYYLDETADIFKSTTQKASLITVGGSQICPYSNKVINGFRASPIVSFRVDSNHVPLEIPIRHTRVNDNVKRVIGAFHPGIGPINSPVTLSIQVSHQKSTPKDNIKNNQIKYTPTNIRTNSSITSQEIIDNETCQATTDTESNEALVDIKFNISQQYFNVSTIAYDRIKFFELYDKNTPLIYQEKSKIYLDDIDEEKNGNRLNHVQTTIIEQVEKDVKYKARHSKKHITEINRNNSKHFNGIKKIVNSSLPSNITIEIKSNITSIPLTKVRASESNVTKRSLNISSKIADWSDYSFMAVYIFEPSQVHCDAAAISPHWLVTSGSCLSRHHKNPGGEGRSAFVAYCGTYWWTAERVAYVKYSVVHPSFHQRDIKRRHMYNIGLIQVVISMDTCPGWTPVSLMSHRYVTDPDGTVAHAVGWGLDRYDTRYSSADLPKLPLMKFESKIYSDSCPGNYGYLQAMHLHESGGVKNLYCMLLPPYEGETKDPIHGSMLIVGEKLCAIYLQEERRSLGEQCGIYTGIWRLGPWVTDVAREPDDVEPFRIDI